ncbi:MAG: hypothetical protein ABI351_13960 [Herbaspirillum sp.]
MVSFLAVAVLGIAASTAIAQPTGPGPGMMQGNGSGAGPGMMQGGASGAGPGARGGYGNMGKWHMTKSNTYGYGLMTPEERTEHRDKMRSMTSYDECKAYIGEHQTQMEARAKEKGATVPAIKNDPCSNMKARGRVK